MHKLEKAFDFPPQVFVSLALVERVSVAHDGEGGRRRRGWGGGDGVCGWESKP